MSWAIRAELFGAKEALSIAVKEVRFTRGGQAAVFIAVGVALASVGAAGVILGIRWPWRDWPDPLLPSPWWGVGPLLPAAVLFYWAGRLARQPFLVFSPVGLEIYPLWRPEAHSQLVAWTEVASLTVQDEPERLVLDFADVKDAGIVIYLAPIARAVRPLLRRTAEGMNGRLQEARTGARKEA